MRTIDLNADLGEEAGDDEALLDVVTSANVACGAHAGGAEVMAATCAAAHARGVRIGAHPGYPDRARFGRVELELDDAEIGELVAAQVAALRAAAAAAGAAVAYLKPHGALYHRAARSPATARAVVAAAPGLAVMGPPGSALEEAAEVFLAEGFVDRGYTASGALVPRDAPGATLDRAAAVAQALALAVDRRARTPEGGWVTVDADSLCLHGDTPGAVAIARAVRRALAEAGVDVGAP